MATFHSHNLRLESVGPAPGFCWGIMAFIYSASAPLKHALDHEAEFDIVINLLEVHIPENTLIENRLFFFRHDAKVSDIRNK